MKTFKQTHLTKRFLAIVLSLIFALSSFTIAGFVPTMEAQAASGNSINSSTLADNLIGQYLISDSLGNNVSSYNYSFTKNGNVTYNAGTTTDYSSYYFDGNSYLDYTFNNGTDNLIYKILEKAGTSSTYGYPFTISFMMKSEYNYSDSTEANIWGIGTGTTLGKYNTGSNSSGSDRYFAYTTKDKFAFAASWGNRFFSVNSSNRTAASDGWDYYTISFRPRNGGDNQGRIMLYRNGVYTNGYNDKESLDLNLLLYNSQMDNNTTKHVTIGHSYANLAKFKGYIRDFRYYAGWFEESGTSTTATAIMNDQKTLAQSSLINDYDKTPTVDNATFVFDAENAIVGTESNSVGHKTPSITDSTNNTAFKSIQWKALNKQANSIYMDNAYVSTTSAYPCNGKYWQVIMDYAYNPSQNNDALILGVGSGDKYSKINTGDGITEAYCADLFQIAGNGNVYIYGNTPTVGSLGSLNSTVKKTIQVTYSNGELKFFVDGVEKVSTTVDNTSLFEKGPQTFFFGAGSQNYWGGSVRTYGSYGADKCIYGLNLIKLQAGKTKNTPEPIPDPEVPEKITYDQIEVSELKTAIDSYESTFAAKVTNSTSALAGLAAGYKTYMKAKSYYDACKYGQELNTITVDQITNITNDLNTATSNIANATVVKMKDKQNMAKYRKPIGSSSSGADIASSKTVVNPNGNILATLTYDTDSSANDSYFRNVVYYQSGLTSPRNANTISSSQGEFQFVIPQAIGVYRGDTPVRFPIITQVSVGGGQKYKYIAVKDSIDTNGNTVMFGDFWLRTTWVFTDCNYGGIVNNNGANAHALASGYETSTNTYFDTLNGSNNHYANVLVITPKSDTIYATVNNFTVDVNGSGSGSVANSSGLGIVVLNYKKYIDDINTSWSTLKSVVSTTKIQGSDVDNSKIYNYLNNVDNCNNFNPYNTSNAWANYTNCTGTLSSAVTYNTLLNSAKNALHSDDNNYKTLRSYIDTYGKYLNNDDCYSAYPEYKVARETAINTIVAPSKSSSFDYNQIDASIANNLKNAYETMIASAKAHTYTNTGVLNQTNKTIDYKCLVNDADSHVDHVDASAYISSIDTLISEIAKTNKYKSDVIEHAQGVLDTHGLTNNEETESNSKVYIAHGDIESTINTYTEEILTEISNMRENRDGLNDVTVTYAYEKDNESVGAGATKIVKYGDLITESGYELKAGEHIVKWTVEANDETKTLNYNPTTNVNYEATKNATVTCYIETDNSTAEKPYTVQFIDKAGRVRAIAYANDDTVFSVDANGVKADDQLVYEGDKLPYYQIRGFKVGASSKTTYVSNDTFKVSGNANIYTAYTADKPITITLVGDNNGSTGNKSINGVSSTKSTTYTADWDEVITIKDTDNHGYYWYLNGVLAGKGTQIQFRANNDTAVTMVSSVGAFPKDDVTWNEDGSIGVSADVSYFKYNEDLNRVTAVTTFVAFDSKANIINSRVTEAGVILSTTASDAETIKQVGKKFSSTKITDLGNQVHIAVSRTAKTEFTMYAIPYVVLDGDTEHPYYGTTVRTIHYPEQNA